jgi:hypothetical protein
MYAVVNAIVQWLPATQQLRIGSIYYRINLQPGNISLPKQESFLVE